MPAEILGYKLACSNINKNAAIFYNFFYYLNFNLNKLKSSIIWSNFLISKTLKLIIYDLMRSKSFIYCANSS